MKYSTSDINIKHPMVRFLPEKALPFAMLVRLDRPIGTYLCFLPALMGLNLAFGQLDDPDWRAYFGYLAIFFLGALFMRSAGCIWNDVLDRDIDAQVARTKHRPLASGVISVSAALSLMGVLLLLALGLLLLLPRDVLWVGAGIVPFIMTYPLMKRFFPYPQLWLGLTFTTGVWVAWMAVHGTQDLYLPLLLFLGCLFWTAGYDTVYALQDMVWDKAQGLRSMPLSLGRYVFLGIAVCYLLTALLWAGVLWQTEGGMLPESLRFGLFFVGWGYLFLQVIKNYFHVNQKNTENFQEENINFLQFWQFWRNSVTKSMTSDLNQHSEASHRAFFVKNAMFGFIISASFF